jgi:hypothetical protein
MLAVPIMRVDIKSFGIKLFWDLQVQGHTENVLANIHCLEIKYHTFSWKHNFGISRCFGIPAHALSKMSGK